MNKRIVLFVILLWWPLFCFSANLLNVDVQEKKIIFSLSEPVNPRIFALSNPNRIVLDFDSTRLTVNLKKIRYKNKAIASIREGHPKPNVLRIVLDTNLPYKNISKKNSRDIILQFPSKGAIAKKSVPPPMKPIFVVIDPGHGGKDPGAIGERAATVLAPLLDNE